MIKSLPLLLLCSSLLLSSSSLVAQPPATVRSFITMNCSPCHNAKLKSGNLDLSSLPFSITDSANFAIWSKIHDRVRDGEMPPVKTPSLTPASRDAFLGSLSARLVTADRAHYAAQGRSTWRRMNRYEYENTLRDLLGAPWLQVKDMLPEDGEAYRFNKVGEALDVSHVNMNQYLAAAEYALREALPKFGTAPPPVTTRYYAREQGAIAGKVLYPKGNERNAFPVIGSAADVAALKKTAPMTVGARKPEIRELEGLAVVASTYEPIELRFNRFTAPVAGRYKLRLNAQTVWVGPDQGKNWWKPDPENISAGRTDEPVTLYSEIPPRQMRRLGSFDVHPDPTVNEIEVYLLRGESIRPDAVRFFRSRPPGNWRNPLATPEGQPGVSFRWLEVEGPLIDQWPTTGRELLFADLPYTVNAKGVAEFESKDPAADSRRLLRNFLARAYRHPVPAGDVERFAAVTSKAMAAGFSFTDAMVSTYSAVLCSPAFVTLEEKPGRLDSYALASRLSYFLWNSEPDAKLRQLAASNQLQNPSVLRDQTKRMLADPKSQRFVQAFLDYWLDLRKLNNTSPDSSLYPDYYLDDFLVESAGDETRAFFNELLCKNLPARNLVSSNFAMLNERLAALYGIPGVTGVAIRPVTLPPDSPRGGLMTQASILKVTANGTTTSPVLRGVWITERILGHPVPPPPAGVPALDPDTRGATTIREQLAQHRSQTVCKSCHAKLDPPGFALENFDVAGGWRDRYRALPDSAKPDTTPVADGIGKGGHFFEFHYALPVDASGTLTDGRSFADIRELKRLILSDERQIARNLASQLIVYSTGAPVRFGDRPQLEAILDQAKSDQYGVMDLINAIVESDLFRSK
jgi:hypothetical protein